MFINIMNAVCKYILVTGHKSVAVAAAVGGYTGNFDYSFDLFDPSGNWKLILILVYFVIGE